MKKKLFSSATMNLLLQLSVVVSGLIVPNLIIKSYGSEVNGLITSITQLLSYITLLESGIGGVIKSELYKPLLTKDSRQLGGIINAANSFFRKIGVIFIFYLLFIAINYNTFVESTFDYWYVFSLVIILGINTVTQYFIGITYQLVLQADQNYFYTSFVQIITLWINILATVILINLGFPIHAVKLVTIIVFAFRPICFWFYAKKNVSIDFSVPKNHEALAQRWDGFGHHIAYFIHTNTDVVLVTFFLNLKEVSVYSIYYMIVTGVRSFIAAISSVVEPYLGMLIAKGDKDILEERFSLYELFHFFISAVLFGATFVLTIPFVSVYTKGVTDIEYQRPVFAAILIAAESLYCLRNPYSSIVFAAGHFKQTKIGAYVEAMLNIVVSIALINKLGIIGVAIGTFCAMLFRTIQYVYYLSKNIINRPMPAFFVRLFEFCLSCAITSAVYSTISINISSYAEWVIYAICVTIVSIIVSGLIFVMFSPKDIINGIRVIRQNERKQK